MMSVDYGDLLASTMNPPLPQPVLSTGAPPVSTKRKHLLAVLALLLPAAAFVAMPASATTSHHQGSHHTPVHHTSSHHGSTHHGSVHNASAHHSASKTPHHTAS